MWDFASSAGLGLLLGLSLAAPPGPMNALIAAHATQNGFGRAVRVGLAAPIVDTFYLLVVTFGVARLFDLNRHQMILGLAGALLMAYLAWSTARMEPSRASRLPGFWVMTGLSLTNPYQIGWWVTAGTAFLLAEGAPGAVGFVGGIFSWVFVFAFLMSHGAKRWSWFTPVTQVASADLLVLFALLLATRALSGV